MYPQNDMNSLVEKMNRIIGLKSDQIFNEWFEALKRKWGKETNKKIKFLIKEKEEKEDLLSLLLKILPNEDEIKEQYFYASFRKVRTEAYSIFDFFLEVSCLEKSVNNVLKSSKELDEADLLDGMYLIRNRLYGIFGKILKDTSEIYEHVAESGIRSFCHLDTEGRIIYANKEMRKLIGLESIAGEKIDSFFEGEDKNFVRRILGSESKEHQGMRQLHLKHRDGPLIPVGVDIGSILIDGVNRGGYISMVDLSYRIKTDMEIFDKSPLGIVKTNHLEQFTYANPKASEICGVDVWRGKSIRDIFSDENYSIVKSHLKKRKIGLSDEYDVEITRLDNRELVPVKISATPEIDNRGNFIGSMAIIRDRRIEKRIEAIHDHTASIREGTKILEKVSKEVKQVIPFDRFCVLVFNAGMTHLRRIFDYYPEGKMEYNVRWWEIPDYLVDWLTQKRCTVFDSIEELFNEFDWHDLKDRPGVKAFLKEGFRSFLRCPVFKGDRIVASVSLYSKKDKAFDKSQKEDFEKLPIHKAVLMALYYEEIKELKFRLNLMKDISSSACNIKDISSSVSTLENVATTVVNRIAEQYDWENIALFKVDEKRNAFRLLSQKTSSEESRYPKDFIQSLDEGILGEVYKKNEPVNIGNVDTDPRYKQIYKKSLIKTKSELCIPIKANEVFWLLNVEDFQQNAFSEEEKEALMGILFELRGFLDRLYLFVFLSASLANSSDGVIVTDIKGNIKQVNPATTKLLGYSQEEMTDRSFIDFFKDKSLAQYLFQVEKTSSDEVVLLKENGGEINVILSRSQLQDIFTDKVFFITDLSLKKHLEKLKYINKMYYEIALQTKTPLSLIFSWLKKLKREGVIDSNTELSEILDKAIRQLRKVELTYDRLSLYDKEKGEIPYTELLLSMSEVLNNVTNELPKTEIEKIDIEDYKELPYLYGDIFQLSFSFMSIISYLLRFVPDEEKIRVEMSHDKEWLVTSIKGFIPELSKEESKDQVAIAKTLAEMALGEDIIRAFIGRHGGKYHVPVRKGDKVRFRIDLPIAKGY